MTAMHFMLGFFTGGSLIASMFVTYVTGQPWIVAGILSCLAASITSGVHYKA